MPKIAVPDIQVQRSILQAAARGEAHIPIDTPELVFFQDDIDDASRAFRVIFSAGAGDDLDVLDLAGGDGLEGIRQVVAKDAGRLAIDKEEDI